METGNPSILVTGDVVLDHNLYAGKRLTADAAAGTGLRHVARPGGAMLGYGLLRALREWALESPPKKRDTKASVPDVLFGLKETTAADWEKWPRHFKVGAVWDQFDGPRKNEPVWRLAKNLGYGPVEAGDYPAEPAGNLDKVRPRVIVIDDGGLGFRFQTAERCWPLALRKEDRGASDGLEWIILKMSSPLARGDLWRALQERVREKDRGRVKDKRLWDRLIVVVAADNLRRADVRVARGLSWEDTVDDLVAELRSNPLLAELHSCRHLVVTMRGDAALWLAEPRGARETCRLVFDRWRAEGEWEDGVAGGNAFGYLSAMTASLAWHLRDVKRDAADCNLTAGLIAGLSASRFLREYGHGPVKGVAGEPGFPFGPAAAEIAAPTHAYACTEVPCGGVLAAAGAAHVAEVAVRGDGAALAVAGGGSADGNGACEVGRGGWWTILRERTHCEAFTGPLIGPARRLALLGPSALEGVPCARFGKFLTFERREIEALRSLRQLMLSYRDGGPQKQPLSLAVFGAPGSGKSFALKQIAEGVFGERNPILEFNLSQFTGPEDLIGAYHQVRDHVLAGRTPVAFWDEFDSRSYFWLQYLLAPMQDGSFQEGQLTHSIGKCVFVFAGGTSRDFEHFGPPEEPAAAETDAQMVARAAFGMAKGPDFKSRLAGFFNVSGPNPRQQFDANRARGGLSPWQDDREDVDYPIRRAILLRNLLGYVTERADDILDIDRGLLTALLEVGHYRHGVRSLEKLVGQMRDRGGLPLRRAHLPSDELLGLYVDDVAGFHALIRRSYGFVAQAERLAVEIHQGWRDNLSDQERRASPNDVPYEQLSPETQAANVAAAVRIPETLALTGYMLVKGEATADEERPVRDFLAQHLDVLAEAEHDGWADQKRMEGWTYGPERDELTRKHHLLVPYAALSEEEKDKDRVRFKNYPEYAKLAGFKIVRER